MVKIIRRCRCVWICVLITFRRSFFGLLCIWRSLLRFLWTECIHQKEIHSEDFVGCPWHVLDPHISMGGMINLRKRGCWDLGWLRNSKWQTIHHVWNQLELQRKSELQAHWFTVNVLGHTKNHNGSRRTSSLFKFPLPWFDPCSLHTPIPAIPTEVVASKQKPNSCFLFGFAAQYRKHMYCTHCLFGGFIENP